MIWILEFVSWNTRVFNNTMMIIGINELLS